MCWARSFRAGLVGRLAKRFGEVRLIVAGTLLSFLALGFLPYAPSTGPLLAILAVLAVGQGIAHPSLSALTSKLVDPDEVGGVMGVYQGMSSLARIIGPFWARSSTVPSGLRGHSEQDRYSC